MNHRKTDFITRFRLLNSQDNTEEIVWSCSSSSDNENNGGKINSIQNRKHSKTRKRKASKMMFNNDISNLHLTISDTSQESRGNYNTSPILKPRLSKSISIFKRNNSPALSSEIKESTSPILLPITDNRSTSPVLVSKLKENTPGVCKKLFNSNVTNQYSVKKRCISPIVCKGSSDGSSIGTEFVYKSDNNQNKTALVEKIKSYFQRSLSTESLSQNSISEYSTPKNSSKTSDEVEIIDFTQGLPLPIKQEVFSLTTHSAEKSKKVKYKKDGLAYRLDNLLKKQNAHISLWQHEQYLSINSNFIMPKGACLVFRIKKVDFKFGCFLLLAISDKDEVFIILINKLYVKEKMDSNVILKIYEPYKVLDFNDKCKLIVNVCKYVCESFIL